MMSKPKLRVYRWIEEHHVRPRRTYCRLLLNFHHINEKLVLWPQLQSALFSVHVDEEDAVFAVPRYPFRELRIVPSTQQAVGDIESFLVRAQSQHLSVGIST